MSQMNRMKYFMLVMIYMLAETYFIFMLVHPFPFFQYIVWSIIVFGLSYETFLSPRSEIDYYSTSVTSILRKQ